MTKTRQEVDDIIFNLNRCYQLLSNREMSPQQRDDWLKVLRPYPTNLILDAIDSHISGDSGNDSKFAPKPKHIVDLINRSRDRLRGTTKSEAQEKPCDPKIAKAWVISLKRFYDMGIVPDNNPGVQLEFEQALQIVNAEAKRFNRMDAIPKRFRI